jgi:hypothetical protein
MRKPGNYPDKDFDISVDLDDQTAGKGRMPAGSSPCSTPTAQQSSQPPFSHDGDAQVYIPGTSRSIYSLYSNRRRNTILMAAAFTSIMVPFCDTIYLPALAVSCCCGHSHVRLSQSNQPQISFEHSRQCRRATAQLFGCWCLNFEVVCTLPETVLSTPGPSGLSNHPNLCIARVHVTGMQPATVK